MTRGIIQVLKQKNDIQNAILIISFGHQYKRDKKVGNWETVVIIQGGLVSARPNREGRERYKKS